MYPTDVDTYQVQPLGHIHTAGDMSLPSHILQVHINNNMVTCLE